MNRLGLIHPGTMTGRPNAETRSLYRAFSNTYDVYYGNAFTWKLPITGACVGPPGILLHTPELGRCFLNLDTVVRNLPGLSDRCRAAAILVVAAHEKANYHVYAQARLAVSSSALSQTEANEILSGRCPSTFVRPEEVAFDIVTTLCETVGPLPSELWNAAVDNLGRPGAIALVHIIALHKFVATILNGFDAQLPAPEER